MAIYWVFTPRAQYNRLVQGRNNRRKGSSPLLRFVFKSVYSAYSLIGRGGRGSCKERGRGWCQGHIITAILRSLKHSTMFCLLYYTTKSGVYHFSHEGGITALWGSQISQRFNYFKLSWNHSGGLGWAPTCTKYFMRGDWDITVLKS